jgi:hypothetical protein
MRDNMSARNIDQIVNLANFRAWVARQNPRQSYDYTQGAFCPFAQFLHESGFPYARVSVLFWYPDIRDTRKTLDLPCRVVEPLALTPWTFGALAERLGAR